MEQTWAEWHHMIEEIGGNTGNPEASSSHIQPEGQLPPPLSNIPLISSLESVHHVFTQSLRLDVRSLIWPEAWFPGDDLSLIHI